MSIRRCTGFAVALLLSLTPARDLIVATMTGHMLVQIPLLLLSGFLISEPAPVYVRSTGLNPGGAPGLLLTAAIITMWMVPRALDLAATSDTIAHFESGTLLAGGVMLRHSWRRAGAIGQAFFVGNLTWMAAVAGLLLRDAPVRVCTTYLVRDQLYAGTGLLLLATAIGVRWVTTWLALPSARTNPAVSSRMVNSSNGKRLRRIVHGRTQPLIASASADVSGERLINLRVTRGRVLGE